jgi:hypothetical protein
MFFFSVSFYIIVIVILLNIIFGIIVDTFAQLRDKKNLNDKDKRTSCFICSLSQNKFDQGTYSFETHTKEDHNQWNYLYFIMHLQSKELL